MSNMLIPKAKLDEQVLSELFPIEKSLIEIGQGKTQFKDYTNDNKQELAKTLMRLSYFVGIKEAPSIDQLKMLVPFLITTFPTSCIEELKHAFDLYCGDKIQQIEHYQNFSPMFISKVLKNYLELQNQAKYKARKIRERIVEEIETNQKQKEYNPLHGAYESLCLEYDSFLADKYYEPDELQKYKSYLCLRVCHGANLFTETPLNLDAYIMLRNYFADINPNNYKTDIENYVRNNGKTL